MNCIAIQAHLYDVVDKGHSSFNQNHSDTFNADCDNTVIAIFVKQSVMHQVASHLIEAKLLSTAPYVHSNRYRIHKATKDKHNKNSLVTLLAKPENFNEFVSN